MGNTNSSALGSAAADSATASRKAIKIPENCTSTIKGAKSNDNNSDKNTVINAIIMIGNSKTLINTEYICMLSKKKIIAGIIPICADMERAAGVAKNLGSLRCRSPFLITRLKQMIPTNDPTLNKNPTSNKNRGLVTKMTVMAIPSALRGSYLLENA